MPPIYEDICWSYATANTWKRPIEDFTLIVERPHEKNALQSFMSFCWDGPVTKLDADHFSAHMVNLVVVLQSVELVSQTPLRSLGIL
jgi:hypothetical protein